MPKTNDQRVKFMVRLDGTGKWQETEAFTPKNAALFWCIRSDAANKFNLFAEEINIQVKSDDGQMTLFSASAFYDLQKTEQS